MLWKMLLILSVLAGQTVCKLQMIRLRRNNAPTPPTAAPPTGHLAAAAAGDSVGPSWSLLFSSGLNGHFSSDTFSYFPCSSKELVQK